MDKMNIAYGISAYKDPTQLRRLVGALQGEHTYFFIHIDKKTDVSPFRQALADIPRCEILSERYRIYWGGWNQVLYQMLFLKKMINHSDNIERLFIITGQDYPIWSNKEIMKKCHENPSKIWMKGLNLTKMEGSSHMKRFLSIPHYWRDAHFHCNTLRHYITGIQRELFLKLMPFLRKPYITVKGKQWDIWQSSGYFSCNREVASYILKTIEQEKGMVRYFKHSFVPEEITIPTIIFNSIYKEYAEVFPNPQYEGLSTLAALHCFYYSQSIKIYKEEDFEELIKSSKMFCRKVVTGESDVLLQKIDLYRDK